MRTRTSRPLTPLLVPLFAPLVLAACSDDTSGVITATDLALAAHGEFHDYVASSVTLPADGKDFAMDLDGDGRPDNQLGLIVNVLTQQMLKLQEPVDVTIRQGDAVVLLSVQTLDDALRSDSYVAATYYLGKPFGGMKELNDLGTYVSDGGCSGCPDFSGNGRFQIDGAIEPATVVGTLRQGHFSSESPVTTRHPATLRVRLALGPGQKPAEFIVNGAHVEFDATVDSVTGRPALDNGRIQGTVRNEDVQKNIVPAVASLLTDNIKRFPRADATARIRSVFDNGGSDGHCANPDGRIAKAGDDLIDLCEVSTNELIELLLKPDVTVYDESGAYAPSKTKPKNDSLSVALGFSAIAATFPRD